MGTSDQALIDLNNRWRRAKELVALSKTKTSLIVHPAIVGYGLMMATEPLTVGNEEYSVEEVKLAGQMVMRDYLMELMPPKI